MTFLRVKYLLLLTLGVGVLVSYGRVRGTTFANIYRNLRPRRRGTKKGVGAESEGLIVTLDPVFGARAFLLVFTPLKISVMITMCHYPYF